VDDLRDDLQEICLVYDAAQANGELQIINNLMKYLAEQVQEIHQGGADITCKESGEMYNPEATGRANYLEKLLRRDNQLFQTMSL
jgi:hypothetical protein